MPEQDPGEPDHSTKSEYILKSRTYVGGDVESDGQQGGSYMVKATRRSAVLLGLIAVAVCAFSVPSFAEVQNVKVGGDLTVRAIHKSNTDLRDDDDNDPQDVVQQTVAINIGADLTENVSAHLRFANENDWGSATGSTASGDVDVSQAYAEILE